MSRCPAHLKRITDQLIIELQKIKTADGYGTDIPAASVSKQPAEWFSFMNLPAICVVYPGGKNQYFPGHHQKITKRIQLFIRFRDDPGSGNAVDQISELDEDIDYLMEQNPQLTETSSGEDLVTSWLRDNDDSDKGVFSIEGISIWRVNLSVTYHKTP